MNHDTTLHPQYFFLTDQKQVFAIVCFLYLFDYRVLHEILIPAVWKMSVEKWEIETLQAIVAEEEDPVHSGI